MAESNEGTEKPKEELRCYHGLIAYRELCWRIDKMEARIQELRETMYSISTSRLDGMPRQQRSSTSRQERTLERLDMRQRQLDVLIENEKVWYYYLIDLLDRLSPDNSLVLEMRYLDQAPWLAVADALFGEPDDFDGEADERAMKKTFKYHQKALKELETIWPDDAPMGEPAEGGKTRASALL